MTVDLSCSLSPDIGLYQPTFDITGQSVVTGINSLSQMPIADHPDIL